jgi:cell division protein FtsL
MIALFAEAPALPLHTAGPYVAAAYIVFLLVVLVYVSIMARKLISNSRELRNLRAQIEERQRDQDEAQREPADGPKESEPVA